MGNLTCSNFLQYELFLQLKKDSLDISGVIFLQFIHDN